ncbi:MAG: glutaminyl-peptide cyclotransferase [Pyrinomonadaceae bacterium]
MRICFLILLVVAAASCSGASGNKGANPVNNNSGSKTIAAPLPVWTYEVVNTYPHDPKAFTEGLFYHDGFLYESTGEEGQSTLRKVDLRTGKVVQKSDLPPESFGEGISLINGKIYQLTWREGVCRVFDANDFTLIRELPYQGEGWGMTTDGTNLFMTDKTHVIRVMDPETFKPVRMIVVNREDGKPLYQINELEYIKGEIWANIWHSEDPQILGKPNYIVRIDPASGKTLGWIDLQGISPDDVARDTENTLNGIAYDADHDRIFVTGKDWKKLFEIKVKPAVAQ